MNARQTAYGVLVAVADGGYSNLLLPKALATLPVKERALATELTYGTLRRQGSLDAVLRACLPKGLPKKRALELLRLGAYQLLFTRIPAHAAVAETVRLTKQAHESPALVNAVLRKVAEADWETWRTNLSRGLGGHAALAIEHSYPEWVIDELADAYGEAELTAVLAAGNAAPQVTLVARSCTQADLLALPDTEPGQWSDRAVVLTRGNPGDHELIRSHKAGVQDEGSQLVAQLMQRVDVVNDNGQWIDLCAGPGGKAALLDQFAHAAGGRLLAIEPSSVRAELVRQSLTWGEVQCADGRTAELPKASRILVDAPCTGLGALRRRPESRWRRSPADLPDLLALQGQLLAAAAAALVPGGVLIYSTCSPVRAETDGVVAAFLHSHPDFRLEPVADLIPSLELPSAATTLRLSPAQHGTDGMFAAVLRRSA